MRMEEHKYLRVRWEENKSQRTKGGQESRRNKRVIEVSGRTAFGEKE